MYAKTKCTKQYVRCAISKQKIMYKNNHLLPTDRNLFFRNLYLLDCANLNFQRKCW